MLEAAADHGIMCDIIARRPKSSHSKIRTSSRPNAANEMLKTSDCALD